MEVSKEFYTASLSRLANKKDGAANAVPLVK